MEEDLSKSEASKAVAFKEKLKKALASQKESEAENVKLKNALQALETDLKVQQESVDEYVAISRNFKDMILSEMLQVWTDAVRDFLNSDVYKFMLETKYDAARQEGFDAAVGQLQLKDVVSNDYNLEAEGVSTFNEPDGSLFAPEEVSDEDLFKSEFVELVCEETEERKYYHGGPYLPSFLPRVLMSNVFVPLEDHVEHKREWLSLPGPLLGFYRTWTWRRNARPSLRREGSSGKRGWQSCKHPWRRR